MEALLGACLPARMMLTVADGRPAKAARATDADCVFGCWWPNCCLQIIAQSEGDADDELLSVAVVKGGKKVGCCVAADPLSGAPS